MKLPRVMLTKTLAGIALIAATSLPLASPSYAQTSNSSYDEDENGIFCWKFYPDATVEELRHLCAGDIPPGGGSGGGGDGRPGGPHPWYPPAPICPRNEICHVH